MIRYACPPFVCLLLIGLISTSQGQKFSPGSCSALSSYAVFTSPLASLVGPKWREIARYPTVYRHGWRCVTYQFTTITANIKYAVLITGIKKGGGYGRAAGTVDVVGAVAGNTAAGIYFVFKVNYGGKVVTTTYYLVRTFGGNYFTFYACENHLLGKKEAAIALTIPNLPDLNVAAAMNALSKYGLDRNNLEYTYTLECL